MNKHDEMNKRLDYRWEKIKIKELWLGTIFNFWALVAVLEFANKNKLTIHFGDRRNWRIIK